jgi:hypothetical protein
MRKSHIWAALAILATGSVLGLVMSGCDGTPPLTDAEKVAKTSQIIKLGASTATSIGLVAVPNAEEANTIAAELIEVLDESVLPILSGDEAGLAAGLDKLLMLNFLNDPKLAKAKLLLLSALPLLESNLPGNLLDQQLTKVPEDIKAYLTAFFTGVRDGASAYLGDRGGRSANKWTDLRKKLAE